MRELKHAEEAAAHAKQVVVVPFTLTAELKSAFTAIGQKLPQIWDQALLTREQKKALLRCLVEKIALHRVARDHAQARIIRAGNHHLTDPPAGRIICRSLHRHRNGKFDCQARFKRYLR